MENKNPRIWKKEPCLKGECKGFNEKHWWSVPFTAVEGLVVECFHCGKFKKINID